MVHLALSVLRGFVFLKRHAGPTARAILFPFFTLGRFLLRGIGIPFYRLYFLLRRLSGRMLSTEKNRVLVFATNSKLIHVAAFFVAMAVVIVNIGSNGVRAETYGRQSFLYNLVSQDDSAVLETENASIIHHPSASSYTNDPSPRSSHIDFTSFGTDYAVTTTGGSVSSLFGSVPGQNVRPPIPSRNEVESYVIAEGDTLGGIADRFGLNLSSILWANNLTFHYTIHPGLVLKIPPVDGVLYTVKKGDTLAKIAKTYQADMEEIIAFNKLSPDRALSVGVEILLPGGEPPAIQMPVRRPAPIGNLFTERERTSDGRAIITEPPSEGMPVASRGSAFGKGNWVWPTDWRIITQYFSWRHTGVDIDGDFTTHSYAAAEGVVIYSGWRTGYGMTVEVDHGNGMITRYAHHSKLYVHVGDVVKAGDLLAQTGSTGHSTGTHLHFEVIKNGKFQNPLGYIR